MQIFAFFQPYFYRFYRLGLLGLLPKDQDIFFCKFVNLSFPLKYMFGYWKKGKIFVRVQMEGPIFWSSLCDRLQHFLTAFSVLWPPLGFCDHLSILSPNQLIGCPTACKLLIALPKHHIVSGNIEITIEDPVIEGWGLGKNLS